ncbi:hypothetical protein BJV77DRAFT_339593 [Russula vinacea]|nr:hypothetical protein BJV77DRAFT_339593 [Russula vinacea]
MVYRVWPAHGCRYIKRTSLSFSGRIPLVATDTPRAATLVQTSGPEETVNTTATSKCTQESETSALAPAALCSLRGRSGMCRGLDAVASLPVLMPKQDRVKSVGSCGPPLSGVWFPALLGSSLPSLIGTLIYVSHLASPACDLHNIKRHHGKFKWQPGASHLAYGVEPKL